MKGLVKRGQAGMTGDECWWGLWESLRGALLGSPDTTNRAHAPCIASLVRTSPGHPPMAPMSCATTTASSPWFARPPRSGRERAVKWYTQMGGNASSWVCSSGGGDVEEQEGGGRDEV